MKWLWTLFFFVFLWISESQAVTLTYKMMSFERPCFYVAALSEKEKIGFYFAVQSEGDVDFEIKDPKGGLLMMKYKQRSGDYVFSARYVGDYEFCFSNTQSAYETKVIDFDLSKSSEFSTPGRQLTPGLPNPIPKVDEKKADFKKTLSPMQRALDNIGMQLSFIQRDQRYFRTRENRNFATVLSTETRVFWFALVESVLIVLVSFFQIFMIQSLFTSNVRSRI
jgi:hypothetical protein